MRRIPLLLIAGAIVSVLVLCVGAASPGPSQGPSEIEQLRKEVAALRQRVESLERRQEVRIRPIIPPEGDGRHESAPIDPRHWPRQTPKDWKPFELNGMQFYVIPIDNSHPPENELKK